MDNLKRFWRVLLLIAVVFSTYSCSSNEEPENNTSSNQAEWIRQAVVDSKGEIAFPASAKAGVYLLPAEDADMGRNLCEGIIAEKWDGNALKLSLDDDGSINLSPSSKEGVYYELLFKVKGIPSFTLEVASPEYCESENSRPSTDGRGGFWQCNNPSCRHKFFVHPSKCCFCNGVSFTHHYIA